MFEHLNEDTLTENQIREEIHSLTEKLATGDITPREASRLRLLRNQAHIIRETRLGGAPTL